MSGGWVLAVPIASATSTPVAASVTPAGVHAVLQPLPGLGLLDPIPSLGGEVARLTAQAVFALFTTSAREAATWVVSHALHLAAVGTGLDLGRGSWFAGTFPQVVPIFASVLLPLALVGTIGALLHQDPRRLARVWLFGVPLGAGAGMAVYALVRLAVIVTDELCGLLHPAGTVTTVVLAAGADLAAAPQLVQALVSVIMLVGGLFLWFELVLRAAAVYLALFFMPLAMATLLWPAASVAAKRFVEMLAVLVLAKLVIVGALTVGAGALGAEHGGVGAAITGAAVLLLAAFAPFSVLRLVPIVELGAAAQLEGLSRRPARAVASVPGRALSNATQAGMLLDQLHRSTSGGLHAGAPPRLDLPEYPTSWVLGPDPDQGTAGRSASSASAGDPGDPGSPRSADPSRGAVVGGGADSGTTGRAGVGSARREGPGGAAQGSGSAGGGAGAGRSGGFPGVGG